MKIIIFLSVFLLTFSLSGYYVYIRIVQTFFGNSTHSLIFIILYSFLVSSFLIGKLVEHFSIGFFSDFLIRIGSISIAFFLYALLLVMFFDFIRLTNFFLHFYPTFITVNYTKSKLIIGIISLLLISIIFLFGFLNASQPKIQNLNISINKNESSIDSLNIVAISDIHMGTMVNKTKTKRLISIINQLNPDLIIIAGDLIDDNINVVKHYNLLKYFKELHPKYGVYACLGNHDYISRANKDLNYFEKNGIHILKDSSVLIDDKFYLIGRDDLESKRMTNKSRKSLNELSENINYKLPVILLDHQPYDLDNTAEYPIDLQFSGHTHKGQIWPFHYITKLIFEKDWGYIKKKNTHFYISSGYGTSVMPIRVGSNSEIVSIKLINK